MFHSIGLYTCLRLRLGLVHYYVTKGFGIICYKMSPGNVNTVFFFLLFFFLLIIYFILFIYLFYLVICFLFKVLRVSVQFSALNLFLNPLNYRRKKNKNEAVEDTK